MATTNKENSATTKTDKENERDAEKELRNPLVAVMAIAKDGDGDDMTAKKNDYINVLFTFNHILQCSAVYQTANNDSVPNDTSNSVSNATTVTTPAISNAKGDTTDEKANVDSSSDTTKKSDKSNNNTLLNGVKYVRDKMDSQLIKKELYKMLWNNDEIYKFAEQVNKILSNKNNKHDGLILFITWYGKREICHNYIINSNGESYKWQPIFDLFKNVKRMVYFLDSYSNYNMDKNASKEKNEENISKLNQSTYDELEDEIGFWEWTPWWRSAFLYRPHNISYVLPNATKNGGVMTYTARKAFQSKQFLQGNGNYKFRNILGQLSNIGDKMDIHLWDCGNGIARVEWFVPPAIDSQRVNV